MRPFVLRGHERPINIVKFNYDGDLLFSGSADNKINMWESYTGERIGSFHAKTAVKTIDIDDNSSHLISGGLDGTVQIFKAENGECVKWLKFENKVRYIEYSIGDKMVLFVEERFSADQPSQISVYSFESLMEIGPKQISDKYVSISDVKPLFKFDVFSSSRKKKIVTKASWYINNSIIFISTTDGCLLKYDNKGNFVSEVQAHESNVEIKSFAFSKDYSILATAAVNGSKIFDPETFQLLRVFKQELPMNAVSVSPLFSAEKDNKYHIIIGGGIPARYSALTGGTAGFDIIICNVMYEKELGAVPGHFSPINSLEFFPDGRGFVSGSYEGIMKVFRFDDSYWEDPHFE